MKISLFGATMGLIEKALDIRGAIHRATTSNIANQNTPRYLSHSIDFRSALKQATSSNHSLSLSRTNPNHIQTVSGPSDLMPRPTKEISNEQSPDGNSVDMEREMAELAKNSLMYNATIQIIASRFTGLKNVIREGR